MTVLIDSFILFLATLPIILALCLMLLATYYAQNYGSIIGWSLAGVHATLLALTILFLGIFQFVGYLLF